MQRPTVADLTSESNHFAQLARKTWLVSRSKRSKVSAKVVKDELYDKLEDENFSNAQLLLLEQLQCLEHYLWPGYSEDASNQHVILLALLVNVKRRERLPVWNLFADKPDEFSTFFKAVLRLSIDSSLSKRVSNHLLVFIIEAFQSLDSVLVRKECAPLVSISIWHNLHSDSAREILITSKGTQVQKAWRTASKRYEYADTDNQAHLRFERSWLYTLLLTFLDNLYTGGGSPDERQEDRWICERTVELLCDLQSQLPTRRYTNTLIHDLNLLSAIKLSPLYQDEDSRLLRELYEILEHYIHFPVDNQSGQQLTHREYEEQNNVRTASLQNVALAFLPEKLKLLYLSNYGSLSDRGELQTHLDTLTDAEIAELCAKLNLRTSYPDASLVVVDKAFLIDIVTTSVEKRPYFSDQVRSMPTLPTEDILYDKALLRTDEYDGSRPLAIPKLNLQYLSTGDFLWRSFVLHRAEAFYEIRKHIEDSVKRLQPKKISSGKVVFDGFSRLAIPINPPAIIETTPPKVGEEVPAEVKSEIILDVSRLQPGLRREWDSLRSEDVVFLLAVQPEQKRLTNGSSNLVAENEKAGIKYVRCAEVINVLDENGRVLRTDQDRHDDAEGHARPRQRRLLLRLDAASYKADQNRLSKGDIYESINLVVRRRARENNFKFVLESIKNLTTSNTPVPIWLRDVFLGFGDPASASYKRLSNGLKSVDFRDTFVDWQHLIEALPGKTVEPDPSVNASFGPPYVLESTQTEAAPAPRPTKKRKREAQEDPEAILPMSDIVRVSTYKPPNTGPYPTDVPKLNTIRFTPAQIEAITSGTQPGLTLIVGPPGTGKTDVTTQIISNIYHNFPSQRTLLIAHSNQALNQLFAKIVALDIDERHLLRLGHGEEELRTEASFSKAGRVESFLERGSADLAQVQKLAASINAPGAHGNSCETAAYFEQVYVTPIWKRFWTLVDGGASAQDIASGFPFLDFFADAPQPLFLPDADRESAIEVAKGCERHIGRIFDELADIRPFEILRSQRDKSNYLLVKEARIIAMTSTHAAMRRQEIASLGFKYDNVIVEEAAQITEVEDFIPLAMQNLQQQNRHDGELKRIVLVGDHLQNSPVIQSSAFRNFANLEQSLFLRLIRLGVPRTMLNAQGRARPSLAALYRWRYPQLTDLPITSTAAEFLNANAGLRYDHQFIDIPDYKDRGENEPSPHYIQNLGEAEYAVALYQYMRLLGYPAERISILTTYAGQRALIRDVLTHRCKGNRFFGMPGWVGTVDKYQGEQNDYIILSLVRTKTPGYLRDLRRLTVALSRARLGLYVLGRREVFQSSLELREAFEMMFRRSSRLQVVTGEMWPSARKLDDDVSATELEGVEHLGQYVFEMTKAKVQALKEGGGVLPPPAQIQGTVEEEEDDREEAVAVDEDDEAELDDGALA